MHACVRWTKSIDMRDKIDPNGLYSQQFGPLKKTLYNSMRCWPLGVDNQRALTKSAPKRDAPITNHIADDCSVKAIKQQKSANESKLTGVKLP